MEVALTYHYLGLNIQSISILNRAKEIFQLNKISKDDARFIQLEEAFCICQEN